MANPLHQPAASNPQNICNAESDAGFVSKSDVLEIIGRQRAAFEYLNVAGGLSADSACRYTRERFEIVAGKLMALDSIRNLVCQMMANDAGHLMAEKPALRVFHVPNTTGWWIAWDGRCPNVFEVFSDKERLCVRETPTAVRAAASLAWVQYWIPFPFFGTAEEQPKRREESGPTMGIPPVTSAPANPLPAPVKAFPGVARNFLEWCELNLDGLTSKELAALSDLALDELESRGTAERWQLVS